MRQGWRQLEGNNTPTQEEINRQYRQERERQQLENQIGDRFGQQQTPSGGAVYDGSREYGDSIR